MPLERNLKCYRLSTILHSVMHIIFNSTFYAEIHISLDHQICSTCFLFAENTSLRKQRKSKTFVKLKLFWRMENNSTEEVHQYSPGNIGYLLTCTAFVWLMIPGVGYFYSGMARSKRPFQIISYYALIHIIVIICVIINIDYLI